MANETQREVYRALRDTQNKYTYFLLAAAGGAIALAANQTQDVVLSRSQIPLALGVLAWGLSFFFGCRHLGYVTSTLYANMELLRVQSGQHPQAGQHPQVMAAASEGIRQAIDSNADRAARLSQWQFRFLVAGGVLYVVWHIWEMYLLGVGQGQDKELKVALEVLKSFAAAKRAEKGFPFDLAANVITSERGER